MLLFKPEVDVCVLVHNRPDVTLDFFTHIMGKTGNWANFLFLDNGSTDPDVGRLFRYMKRSTSRLGLGRFRGRRAKFYQASENMMFAGGNNYLATKGRAKWILFLNNDAFPRDDDWLQQLIRRATYSGWAAAGPISNAVTGIQDIKWSTSLLKPPLIHEAKYLSGFCLLVRRDVFEGIGGWDEQFDNGDEDLDLTFRIRQAGHAIGVHRGVYVHHLCSQSLQPWAEAKGDTLETHFAKTRVKLLAKHNERVQNDLWYWEQLFVPKSDWPKHGVLPNGYFYYPPGRYKDQTRAFYAGKPESILFPDELHSGASLGSGAHDCPASASELHSAGAEGEGVPFEYHIGTLQDGGFNVGITERGSQCRLLDDGRTKSRETFCGYCEARARTAAASAKLNGSKATDGHVRHDHGSTVRPARLNG